MPTLLNAATGMPLFEPMAYILTQVRATAAAANTITAHLSAIAILLIHTDTWGIDLSRRIASGAFLDLNEIDALAAAVKLKSKDLLSRLLKSKARTHSDAAPTIPLERVRKRAPVVREQTVNRYTAANRMRVIYAYLYWLTDDHLARIQSTHPNYGVTLAKRDQMLEAIDARILREGSSSSNREGLDPEEREALLECIEPNSPNNPWKDSRVAARNKLIVLLLYHLGIRGGELLAAYVDDLDFRSNAMKIVRRPDNPLDPRSIQPTVKTLERILPVNQGLIDLAFAYLGERRAVQGSSKHPFLLVETDHGRPLSKSALAKIFKEIRSTNKKMLSRVTPHVLRHDWNDRFSEAMDRGNVPEAKEEKYRSNMMGWAEGSNTAETYTKRHIRRKASEYSLKMQAKALGDNNNG
ncbi:tyrosine-type recombinase/integrase [Aliidongia dinghuensis]|uniref:tyrosine-type recombinase/integrase n=1 Tax=Aliidongia dinghuensis TaxID=1867774 RepID=UPI0016650D93|nr:site-specific integrase [Aliidongia dinghuensis]